FFYQAEDGIRVRTVTGVQTCALPIYGQPRLGYRDLRAWDAEGRALASRMVLVDGRVRLVVDDRDARYPVTVDPIAYSISTLQPRSEERRAGKRRPPYWRGSCLRKLDA